MMNYVKRFKYLGVNRSAKLGWDKYIKERTKAISQMHNAMKILFITIRKKDIKIRRKLFCAYILPYYL